MADNHQSLSFLTTTVSSPILLSIERILSGEAAEEELRDGNITISSSLVLTSNELTAGLWTTRITGVISLVSSLIIIQRAWNRREGLFHRLVLGMGIHLTIFGIASTIGAAAIPSTTTNAVGNYGTVATCTAQGVILYVTFLTACSYYGSFSVFSYVGTMNNFEKVDSIEKYIHIFVHIYPICTGIYCMTQDAYINSGLGHCFLDADPLGCGGDSGSEDYVPCEMGPDSKKEARLIGLFWTVFLFIIMIIPTAVMTVLYFQVKKNQSTVQIPAKEVAKQAIVYLAVLYAGVFPSAVVHLLEWSDSPTVIAHLFSDIMFMNFGLLGMLAYLYFTMGDWFANVYYDSDEEEEDDGDNDESLQEPSTDFIFGHLDKALKREGSGNGAILEQSRTSMNNSKKSTSNTRRSKSKRVSSKRFSFNIFDGTNASGSYAEFIYGGDSDDIEEDNKETEKWNAVQDHI